jgi:hypothetical protein
MFSGLWERYKTSYYRHCYDLVRLSRQSLEALPSVISPGTHQRRLRAISRPFGRVHCGSSEYVDYITLLKTVTPFTVSRTPTSGRKGNEAVRGFVVRSWRRRNRRHRLSGSAAQAASSTPRTDLTSHLRFATFDCEAIERPAWSNRIRGLWRKQPGTMPTHLLRLPDPCLYATLHSQRVEVFLHNARHSLLSNYRRLLRDDSTIQKRVRVKKPRIKLRSIVSSHSIPLSGMPIVAMDVRHSGIPAQSRYSTRHSWL